MDLHGIPAAVTDSFIEHRNQLVYFRDYQEGGAGARKAGGSEGGQNAFKI